MQPEVPTDALARLDPAARAPERPRLRLGVGAAIVLLLAALVSAVIVSAVGQQAGHRVIQPAAGVAASGGPPAAGQDGAIILVHVLGAVRNGGLFQLREGARVMDAVAAAGGLTESADPAAINLARPVSDGEQLYVPVLGEAQPGAPPGVAGAPGGSVVGGGAVGGGAAGGGAATAPGGKVNLNTASAADLETLPRIGPALAQRIIDYRTANGRFSTVDGLRNVTGIGEKTFEGLKELVTV